MAFFYLKSFLVFHLFAIFLCGYLVINKEMCIFNWSIISCNAMISGKLG